jgi:hypothetical protein
MYKLPPKTAFYNIQNGTNFGLYEYLQAWVYVQIKLQYIFNVFHLVLSYVNDGGTDRNV